MILDSSDRQTVVNNNTIYTDRCFLGGLLIHITIYLYLAFYLPMRYYMAEVIHPNDQCETPPHRLVAAVAGCPAATFYRFEFNVMIVVTYKCSCGCTKSVIELNINFPDDALNME